MYLFGPLWKQWFSSSVGVELFFLERGEKRRFMALRTGGVDQFLGRLFGRRYYKKTAATNSILVNYGSVPAERTRFELVVPLRSTAV